MATAGVCAAADARRQASLLMHEITIRAAAPSDFDFSSYQISVIVLDGSDIGYLKIDRTDREIFLANVHVHPDYQNQGIGSRIIQSLLVDAGQQGVPVSLKVLKVNQAARRLYERFGFRVAEEAKDYYLMRALPDNSFNPTPQ